MRNTVFIAALTIIFFSCNSSSNKKSNTTKETNTTITSAIVSVDSLVANPTIYLEKIISIKGLVIHTCKHSGKKMFLVGTDKNSPVKVIAGNSISLFEQSLEGETVIATGKITLMEENGEKHEDHEEHKEKEEHKNHGEETTSKDSTTVGCVAETNIKKYEMVCDEFSVVKE